MKFFITLACAAALAFIGPAHAQMSPLQVSETFSACAVSREQATIQRGLIENWTSANYLLMLKNSTQAKCMAGAPSFPTDAPELRMALARHWLRQQGVLNSTAVFANVRPLTHQTVEGTILRAVPKSRLSLEERQARYKALTDQREMMSRMGECVARRQSEGVRRFLLAGDQAQTTVGIAAALAGCAPPNTQVKLSRNQVSGMLALGYARLLLASQGTSSGVSVPK